MLEAYVTGRVIPGSESMIKEKVARLKGVKKVSIVYGEVDFVAEVEVRELAELGDLAERLRRITSIIKTETYIVRTED